MVQNTSGLWDVPVANSSTSCSENMTNWEEQMKKMYSYFYLLLFIPGLLLNTIALWVLCRHISKKTKAVIFMINLAFADLAHILSLPLRIYYYFTHSWPFGHGVCLFCFYLKYLNMYAAIVFLMCISVQRCVFLLKPFSARRWRRRYDVLISLVVWVVVGLCCSPFILMRSSPASSSSSLNTSRQPALYHMTYSMDSTAQPDTQLYSPVNTKPRSVETVPHSSSNGSCFKDLPMRRLGFSVAVTMMTFAELFGFLIPLACISYSSLRIARSLTQKHTDLHQDSSRNRTHSFTSNGHSDKYQEKQTRDDKRRALRMVLSCSGLFLFCFAPYHINFLLYLMVSQDIVTNCGTRMAVRQFHPVSLCIASLSCCLNPLLYYFLTAEFRMHLTRRTSSFSGSLLSSPLSSPTEMPATYRVARMDSSLSECDSTLVRPGTAT